MFEFSVWCSIFSRNLFKWYFGLGAGTSSHPGICPGHMPPKMAMLFHVVDLVRTQRPASRGDPVYGLFILGFLYGSKAKASVLLGVAC